LADRSVLGTRNVTIAMLAPTLSPDRITSVEVTLRQRLPRSFKSRASAEAADL
jgi:hypothetical protein